MAFATRTVLAGFWLALAAAAPARALETGAVAARLEPQGYARISFAFDRLPRAEVRLANSVLVVSFAEPVQLKTADLVRGLADLVGVVRTDPDGTAIRMALQRPVKLVTTEAGETLFVDLLPPGWSGLPPPLPRETIAALTRESRQARELRDEEKRRRARPDRALTIEGATHPTFRRLVLDLGGDAPVTTAHRQGAVKVAIAEPYRFDLAAIRAALPIEFAGLTVAKTASGVEVSAPAAEGATFRGFHEDGTFVLDIDKVDAKPEPAPAVDQHAVRDAAPTPDHAPSSPAPVQPKAAKDAHAPQTAHAAEPPAAAPQNAAPQNAAKDASGHEPAAPQATVPARQAPAAAAAPARPAAPAAESPARLAAPSTRRDGQTLRLTFPFAKATAAAVFQRGPALWLVFDDAAPIDFGALAAGSGGALSAPRAVPVENGAAARFVMSEPRLVSVAQDGKDWIVSLGDDVLQPSIPLRIEPTFDEAGRATAQIDAPGLGAVRRIRDPEVGDEFVVASLKGPARNVPRPQHFVEFTAAATALGAVIQLAADDARVVARMDRLVIERDAGLTLSSAEVSALKGGPADLDAEIVLNAAMWKAESETPFNRRENELIGKAALAGLEERPDARLALARFYLARDRAADAKAVLDAIVQDGDFPERDPRVALMRAATEVEMKRPGAALGVIASSGVRLRPEAALWRAAAEADLGRAGAARAALKQGQPAMAAMPPPLQARFLALAVELALDAGDAATAASDFERLEVLPATTGLPARDLLRARVAEALGQKDRASSAYATIARRGDSAAAAEAELRSIELGLKSATVSQPDAIARLERLVTGWRGDETEAKALSRLIELYGDAGRWRDAFSTLRVAVEAFPDAEGTRALQDRMQERFTDLFLGAGLDSLPRVDALALFYDFKELSPGGKRGDELVRRLADKLVEVDLLDQASDLLNYQIDNRLTGAARAQVAGRAALVELMNGKPARALEVLRKTRQADLPASLMRDRLALEARALAETGRTDLALEITEGLKGAAAFRLKADILWSARRWGEAGEAIEALLGSSWRAPGPLDPATRADVLRAAIALSLSEDGLGVDRLRQKFSPKMADSPEAASFEVVTAPLEAQGDAFREIARSVAASSSFDGFLQEYRKRSAEEVLSEPRKAPGSPPQAGAPSRA